LADHQKRPICMNKIKRESKNETINNKKNLIIEDDDKCNIN
jgi:hypothetical protein